jgi:hypothetical protein
MNNPRPSLWIWFAWILVVAGFLAAAYGYRAFVSPRYLWQVDKNDLAAAGSFFQGAVGSLWSLAAFIFIFVTFQTQQKEIVRQCAASAQERFESIFFELLRIHHGLIADMQVNNPVDGGLVTGRSCFRVFYEKLCQLYDDPPHPSESSVQSLEELILLRVDVAYQNLYQSFGGELGHYFRNLYHVIRFVDESQVSEPERKRYMKILRAQLSSRELLLFFYNGLSEVGQKLKPLTCKYALLEQLPERDLLNETHTKLYAVFAYVDRPGDEVWDITNHAYIGAEAEVLLRKMKQQGRKIMNPIDAILGRR